jgi:Fe-S cluster biogenesis protein NfuA
MEKEIASRLPLADELTESYRQQIDAAMKAESERRITENHDPIELERLRSLSLIDLFNSNGPEIIPSLMARLGPVRAALDGHGGGLIVTDAEIEKMNNGKEALSLILDLDGACVSCGAAPGTLRGIQDDLLIDGEVISVRFAASMLDWFDELQREFVLVHGGVTFV